MLEWTNWELACLAGLAVDAVAVYLLNRCYHSQVKDANLIAQSKSYDCGDDLKTALSSATDNCLPYACVVGVTSTVGAPLSSHYTESLGVIRHQLYVEHKSKRTQGFWTDWKNVISDQLNSRPFVLKLLTDASGGQCHIEVTDALSAEYLQESLSVTHNVYHPTDSSLLSRGVDRLFGEVTKGFQETEKMLGIGVRILGVGKLMLLKDDRVVLEPPGDGRRYFLTQLSRHELVASLKSVARTLNRARWVLAVAGLAGVAYFVHQAVRRYRAWREYRRLIAKLRCGNQPDACNDAEPVAAALQCLICLGQPREVVLLDCGHVCLCAACAAALPSPKVCPICRQQVTDIRPAYIS